MASVGSILMPLQHLAYKGRLWDSWGIDTHWSTTWCYKFLLVKKYNRDPRCLASKALRLCLVQPDGREVTKDHYP